MLVREVRGVPLEEIRRRFAQGSGRITSNLLRALRNDPRAGARAMADRLAARRGRAAAERRRLRELFRTEDELRSQGLLRIAGVDEVGMGPLAGPVVAAAVVLPPGTRIDGLRDSKLLSAGARERLDREIRSRALCYAVGYVGPAEVDRLNVYRAGLLAMRLAVESLGAPPQIALIDGRRVPGLELEQRMVVGGDRTVGSIAAASVLAKVWRDRYMLELDAYYPDYGFARNSGYGTAEHLGALSRRGPSPVHRSSFGPVRHAPAGRAAPEGV